MADIKHSGERCNLKPDSAIEALCRELGGADVLTPDALQVMREAALAMTTSPHELAALARRDPKRYAVTARSVEDLAPRIAAYAAQLRAFAEFELLTAAYMIDQAVRADADWLRECGDEPTDTPAEFAQRNRRDYAEAARSIGLGDEQELACEA